MDVITKTGEVMPVSGTYITGTRLLFTAKAGDTYSLHHAPSKLVLCNLFYYASQAKTIGKEILARVPDLLASDDPERLRAEFPPLLLDYMKHYQLNPDKGVLKFQEWLDAGFSSKEREQIRYAGERLSATIEAEYQKELSGGFESILFLPDPDGEFTGSEIRRLVQGRTLSR